MDKVSYEGRHQLPDRFLAYMAIAVALCSAVAILPLFPETYRDMFGGSSGRQSPLFALPPLLLTLISASTAALIAWSARVTFKAAASNAPLVQMNAQGVTCYNLRGREASFGWLEITRVSHDRQTLRFYSGSMGMNLLGSFGTVGQDLRAIRQVLAHYRPDLSQMLGQTVG